MEETRFTLEHIWARLDDDNCVTIGITDYAQEEWGEVSEATLPEEGDEVLKEEQFGVLISSQGKHPLYAPVTGEVTELNEEVLENPEIINENPLTDGWLIRVSISSTIEFDELLTEEEYDEVLRDDLEMDEEDEEDEEEEDEEEDDDL
ncbi:MAG: glycine cleavage system protein GcvH [Deltaproteobacteria bacterium]|nr:glycine cleavage system protein GcvH [Deltaproteobacteria bacterium]